MVRHLVLEDDTKEYWGFYLLRGTSVTVSTCVRWPGASLIVIRGHKHLHECAYIGDNSSEELEELMEAIREGTYVEPPGEKSINSTEDEAPANEPELMKRHRADVEFHSPRHRNNTKNYTMDSNVDNSEITDPKVMKILLEALRTKTKQSKGKLLGSDTKSHGHRNSTIAKAETKNFKIDPPKTRTTSEEAFSEILSKLRKLGGRGNAVLEKVNQEFNQSKSNPTNQTIIDTKGRHYSKPPVNYNDNVDHERRKRHLYLSPAHDLAEDDEENDMAIEEGFNPDGIANHRGMFNETDLNDMSNSEFWSSFSSSEEALLNCDGLILNLPLTPHHKCQVDLNEEDVKESYRDNTVTYKVPTNGYYFFVFNSENEVQPNYIRVQFDLEKAVYNVSNPVAYCANSSDSCALDLNFFSSEKLVMELPVNENQTLWNEEFIVVSECEPRTVLYAICVIAVPVLVILFAFT
ncbi:uncharacterized protein LOC108917716 isoform X2 [Anoplophora glabripennis]|nr:uncharacterized protein LOC108917716 isoform X2 [Anoplophora glabripennis]